MKNIILFVILVMAAGMAWGFDATAQSEIQQQLSDVSSTLDNAAVQIENVKQKGALQVIWESVTAPLAGIWEQITGIFNQIASIFSILGG